MGTPNDLVGPLKVSVGDIEVTKMNRASIRAKIEGIESDVYIHRNLYNKLLMDEVSTHHMYTQRRGETKKFTWLCYPSAF